MVGTRGTAGIDEEQSMATDDAGNGIVVTVQDSPQLPAGSGFMACDQHGSVVDQLRCAVYLHDNRCVIRLGEIQGLNTFVEFPGTVIAPDVLARLFIQGDS